MKKMRTTVCAAAAGLGLALLAGCGHLGPTNGPAEADVLNMEARPPQGLPVPALDWPMISSSVSSSTDRGHGTMSMLTGNDAAVKYAAAQNSLTGNYPTHNYPVGAELALTTWLQRDDPHWFGARIPGTFVSLETVTVARGADGKMQAEYHRYVGNPLREVANPGDAEARKAYVLGMGASEMP